MNYRHAQDGALLHQAAVTGTFEQIAYLAGLPPIRLHDLRHFAATLALAAGVDIKVVQEQLGHSSRAVTSDTYTSVLPEVARAAAEASAALMAMSNIAANEPIASPHPGKPDTNVKKDLGETQVRTGEVFTFGSDLGKFGDGLPVKRSAAALAASSTCRWRHRSR
jgi:hypothetical protein